MRSRTIRRLVLFISTRSPPPKRVDYQFRAHWRRRLVVVRQEFESISGVQPSNGCPVRLSSRVTAS